ncbi:hypothetical protein N8667_06595 [Verrucomicrobia bacterium]|nr:hypothetical protein [Verrucomicrobiota bacterium]
MVLKIIKNNESGPALMTREQVARQFQITTRTLDLWVDAQKIPVIRMTSGCIRFDPVKVDELIRKHTIKASWEVQP